MPHLRSVSLRERAETTPARVSVQRAGHPRASEPVDLEPDGHVSRRRERLGKIDAARGDRARRRTCRRSAARASTATRRSTAQRTLGAGAQARRGTAACAAASFSAPRISSDSRRRWRRCAPSCSRSWRASTSSTTGRSGVREGAREGAARGRRSPTWSGGTASILDANSHGQSFLKLFQSRFVPDGLYLLDEPEAPLSPQSQLALMSMMGDMLQDSAQFIIATHSPILLGFPGATIYSCDQRADGSAWSTRSSTTW